MATTEDAVRLTFRRYKDGETQQRPFQEQIFQASWSHKCPTYVHRAPPCQSSCPAGEDIRGWLHIARGQEKLPAGVAWQQAAFYRLTEANPFPAIMGRVCPAPCQGGCNRSAVEEVIGINSIEQHIGNYAIENKLAFEVPDTDTGKHVAIVGGGPGGLSAAYQLRRRGHKVTVFERYHRLGGMCAFGLPDYRTSRTVVEAEVQRIVDMGIEARLGVTVGKDVSVDDLDRDYDAVLWAVGCQRGHPLHVEGWAETENCVTALDFLRAFNEKRLRHVPRRVLVVGGGDTSMDVASVSRRLGYRPGATDAELPILDPQAGHDGDYGSEHAQAILTSILPREELPCQPHEIDDAQREGVEFMFSVVPVALLHDDSGRAIGVRMAECHVEKGRPVVHEGTEFDLECDLVVSAIGQGGDLAGLDSLNNGRNLIDADSELRVKGQEKHFVAGDIIRPNLLVTAIGHGRIAAEGIHDYLAGREPQRRPKVDVVHFNMNKRLASKGLEPKACDPVPMNGTHKGDFATHNYEDRSTVEVIRPNRLFLGHFNAQPQHKREHESVSSDKVRGHFGERTQPLTEEQAVAEAKRCMSCGMCFECDNCVIYCPQDAVKRVPIAKRSTGRYVETDYTRCIGCHICHDVCPTGYIEMGLGE